MRTLVCLPLLALLPLACGKPIMGEDYRGVPLFSFQGAVVSYLADTEAEDNLRVSLFWSPTGETRVPVSDLKEQASTSVSIRFPSTFEINIFSPPSSDALVGASPRYGVALVLIYRDLNGNGKFDSGSEELAGGSTERVLLYAPQALAAGNSPTGLPVPRGFSIAQIPFPCGFETELTHGDESCDPRMGGPCEQDSDCGMGTLCLREINAFEFPDGMCTWEVNELNCAPDTGTAIAIVQAYWTQACSNDLDCTREGYSCQNIDAWLGGTCMACWPDGKVLNHYLYCSTHPEWHGDPGCGEHLGGPCTSDQDCADQLDSGKCLGHLGDVVLPEGYCTLDQVTFGCVPPVGLGTMVYHYYWFPRCAADSQCREGYHCDPLYRSCLPDLPMQLTVQPGFSAQRVESLCLE